MSVSRAQILWNSNSDEDSGKTPATFVQDKTWAVNYQHLSDYLADISVKAGSKKMNLASTVKAESGRSKLSEAQLLKKYR